MRLPASIIELCRWLKRQWVAEVPADIAICEFECRKSYCSSDDWAKCVRRISETPSELMPLRHSAGDFSQRQVA